MSINLRSPSATASSFLIADSVNQNNINGSPDCTGKLTESGGSPVSAALEIQSTKGGLLLPRLTTAEMDELNTIDGMVIFNSQASRFKFMQNGVWVDFGGGVAPEYSPANPTYLQDTTAALEYNVSIGTPRPVFGATSVNNTVAGSNAFLNNTGDNNSIFGSNASKESNTVSNCSAFGYGSLRVNESNLSSAFGSLSGYNNNAGDIDCFGFSALFSNVNGNGNSAFSKNSLFSNVSGNFNSSFGEEASYANVTGSSISSFGYKAARNTTVSNVSAYGYNSLTNNTTGVNSAFGANSLSAATTATTCSAFGVDCLKSVTTGNSNTFFGANGGQLITTGTANSGLGQFALRRCTTGTFNFAGCHSAIQSLTTSSHNVGIGQSALDAITTNSDGNIGIGKVAGSRLFSSARNVIIGHECIAPPNTPALVELYDCIAIGSGASALDTAAFVNSIAIGFGTTISQDNTFVLGNGVKVGIGTNTPTARLHVAGGESYFEENAVFADKVGIGATTEPADPLHVVGSAQFQGITAGYTGSGLIKEQKGVRTTGGGAVRIGYPVQSAYPNVTTLKVSVAVMSADGLKAGYAESTAAAFYNGATIEPVGAYPVIAFTATPGYAVSASWLDHAGVIELQIDGADDQDNLWVISSERFSTSNTDA